MYSKIILFFSALIFILPAAGMASIKVKYLQIRECSDIITINATRSLQDKLNTKVSEELNQIDELHRVISINYTTSEGVIRKKCALATVWYEIKKKDRP